MNINWKARAKNKAFWLAFIPAILTFVQVAAVPFGYDFDFAQLGQQLTGAINALFVVLALLGIVTDPTTAGFGDSERALGYDEPYADSDGAEREGV